MKSCGLYNKTVCILILIVSLLLTGCSAQNTSIPVDNDAVLTDTRQQSDAGRQDSEQIGRPDTVRIGVSLQGLQAPYIERLQDALGRMQYKYNGQVSLIMRDGLEDADRQNSQIEEFVVKDVDAIIFNPISYEKGALGLELAYDSNIPVVLLTTTVSNSELASAEAISDHTESAHIQMNMVADYLNKKGNIAILKGPLEIDSSFLRTKGYEDKLAEYPGINVVACQPANWSRSEAYAIVENWLRLGKDIDAVVSQNDNMAIGALQAISDAGKEGEIAVFGIDGDMDALELIRDGRMEGTVYHDAIGQSELAVSYAVQLAKGQKPSSRFVPYKRVEKENVDNYIAILNALNGNYENRF